MASQSTTHTLPPPFSTPSTFPPPLLITQGAEALIYATTYLTPTTKIALKYRPKKSYRHPTLDTRLTKARILAEARVLVRCRKEGVPVPAVLGADWEAGWLATEWIEGRTVRQGLDVVLKNLRDDELERISERGDLRNLMGRIGMALGRLHNVGVVHGDLTTSNLMLRQSRKKKAAQENDVTENPSSSSLEEPDEQHEEQSEESQDDPLAGEVIVIDFGLAVQTVQDEDRAVDLYVLERAFSSTHPQAEGLFAEVLRVYGESYKGAKVVLRRLEDVRLRGRKKSMIG